MAKSTKKYIFITGGVTSSLGKGLAAASIAALLERRGIKINMLKMDPYINVDPGTMSPIQHGEVFVTDDGAETDLDLGHYERFTSLTLSKLNNFTTGQVYQRVIENEREGKYLGKTVQVVPHVTDEIKRRIHISAENSDLLIGEIGGTVGDIESLPFVESIRQFAHDVGQKNVLFIHLVLIPYLSAAKELKTKPAQHSVKALQSLGVFPQIILCRTEKEIESSVMSKLAMFCNIPLENAFEAKDVESIYQVPLEFHKQGLDNKIIDELGIWASRPDIKELEEVVYNVNNPIGEVKIGIVGKYTELTESYKSLDEALRHGAISNKVKFKATYIDAESITSKEKAKELLSDLNGILVPGGFGQRGTEGKIFAIEFARTNKKPYLGICLGMQLAVLEFARNVANIQGATSQEFDESGNLIIHYMDGQSRDGKKGGSMRLGAYECSLKENSLVQKIYGMKDITERHRHRLEVNNEFVKPLEDNGLTFSGINNKLKLVEVVEIADHPYFVGCQYHPEFKSRPFAPHPLFKSFVEAAIKG